jgi:hypothetical protein
MVDQMVGCVGTVGPHRQAWPTAVEVGKKRGMGDQPIIHVPLIRTVDVRKYDDQLTERMMGGSSVQRKSIGRTAESPN